MFNMIPLRSPETRKHAAVIQEDVFEACSRRLRSDTVRCVCDAITSPSLFQRSLRMDAAVMAQWEIRLMVGVTSSCRIFFPWDPSGALSGRELFMALPS